MTADAPERGHRRAPAPDQTVVFLHGLGEGPEVWERQISALPAGFLGFAVGIPGLRPHDDGHEFGFAEAADAVIEELDRRGVAAAHVVGLSLGAMVALQVGTTHPGRVHSLSLAAAQARPPRMFLTVQRLVMSMIPARLFDDAGMPKRRLLTVLDRAAQVDLRSALPAIAVPSLVICGSRDRPNIGAARFLASAIPGAELRIIDGAAHRTHAEKPEAFSAILGAFLERVTAD